MPLCSTPPPAALPMPATGLLLKAAELMSDTWFGVGMFTLLWSSADPLPRFRFSNVCWLPMLVLGTTWRFNSADVSIALGDTILSTASAALGIFTCLPKSSGFAGSLISWFRFWTLPTTAKSSTVLRFGWFIFCGLELTVAWFKFGGEIKAPSAWSWPTSGTGISGRIFSFRLSFLLMLGGGFDILTDCVSEPLEYDTESATQNAHSRLLIRALGGLVVLQNFVIRICQTNPIWLLQAGQDLDQVQTSGIHKWLQ